MRYHQCLILILIFGCVIFPNVSGRVARFTKSANENLHDPRIYIIQFEDTTTDLQQHHFVKQLIKKFNEGAKFEVTIIAEYPNIKCLTSRLSNNALNWVRVFMCSSYIIFRIHVYNIL